jgi:hypothetical protein
MQTTYSYSPMEDYGAAYTSGALLHGMDAPELGELEGFGSKLKKGLKKVGRAVDKSRRQLDDKIFHNSLAKKIGVSQARAQVEKVAHNPAVVRVVGTVVAAVASVVATPAAGAAIMAGVKGVTGRIASNLEQTRAARAEGDIKAQDDAFNKLQAAIPYMTPDEKAFVKQKYDAGGGTMKYFSGRYADRGAVEMVNAANAKRLAAVSATEKTVTTAMEKIPLEQRVVVKDAYARHGMSAFNQPQIMRILSPVLQSGTQVMTQQTAMAEGVSQNNAYVQAQNIASVAPQIIQANPSGVQQVAAPTSNSMPVMLGVVGLLASVLI